MRIGNVVWSHEQHSVSCGRCGARLSADDQSWKDHALVKRSNAAQRLNSGEFGPAFHVYEHEDLELAEIFCPECKALLAVELCLRDEPLRWTFRSLAVAKSQGYDPVAEYEADPESWISFGVAR
jgi:acetone carboxylase gamma subunit